MLHLAQSPLSDIIAILYRCMITFNDPSCSTKGFYVEFV